MKRGQAPDGMNPNPTMFPVEGAPASECGDPEPEAVPDSVYKHLQASMSGSGGMPAGVHAPAQQGIRSPAPAMATATQRATTKHGSAMSGYVVRESQKMPSPGAAEAPRPAPLSHLPQFRNRP